MSGESCQAMARLDEVTDGLLQERRAIVGTSSVHG
jgi:hypothetical protein